MRTWWPVLKSDSQEPNRFRQTALSSTWSGVVSATYVVSMPSLVISKIMYDPPDADVVGERGVGVQLRAFARGAGPPRAQRVALLATLHGAAHELVQRRPPVSVDAVPHDFPLAGLVDHDGHAPPAIASTVVIPKCSLAQGVLASFSPKPVADHWMEARDSKSSSRSRGALAWISTGSPVAAAWT